MGSSEGDIVNNNDDGEMGFQSMFNKSSTGSGNLFGSEWDPLENHHQGLIRHYHSGSAIGDLIPVGVENHHQGLLRHYNQSGSAIGTDSFPKVGSFGPFANINPESGPSSSPNYRAKRRFDTDSNGEKEERNDGLEKDEKKQSIDSTDKQMGKQAKHNSNSGDYIHVRAKRGQATNSHSLAERVRRERISERMKLLQDLVPGCNKITGKAVMLDEIINYVQSLQQQVEFLSMKLATVNPEVNIDIDRLVFKDILQSRGSISNPPFGFGPAISSSHSYPHGSFPSIPTPTSTMHPIHPQPIWDNDLHNLLQMGFDANTGINNLGPNGQAKMNL